MSQPTDPKPPEWAVRQATSALQGGMSALEVEQRLVAVGLAPDVASDVMKSARAKPCEVPPMMDRAMEQARAALRVGMKVPDIERKLVAGGLTPEVAEAVVTNVLGEQVRSREPDPPERQRRRTLHRIASGAVGCLCIVLGYGFGGPFSAFRSLYSILLPLSCIWFGDLSGPIWARFGGRGPVLGVVVRWLGWLILLFYLLYRVELVLYKH